MYKRCVNLLLLLILLVSLLPLVVSAPPVTTVQQFAEGYTIEVHPIKQYFKAGEDVNFHIHIFNTSNGYPVNESIICRLHLYASNGSHLFTGTQNTPDDLYDYEILVLGGNFTTETKSYHAFCYNGGIGGDRRVAIEVNNSGFLQYPSIHIIIFIFFLVLMVGMVVISQHSANEKYYKRTQENYMNKNFWKAFSNGVYYNILNNKFALFYLLGLGVMVSIVNIIYTFNVTSLQTTFDNLMFAYSVGVIFVGVSLLGKLQEFIRSLTKDIGKEKWGVE